MKSLDALIKIYERSIDEKRKYIVSLEDDKDELNYYGNELKKELEQEEKFVANNPEMSLTYHAFKKKTKEKQSVIAKSLVDIDKKIEKTQDEIIAAYSEIKKYEIIIKRKLKQQMDEIAAKETKNLDEMAINSFLKNDE